MDNWTIKETIEFNSPETATSQKAPYILMLPGDNQAHTWEITCTKNGVPADLTGCSVNGYFLRNDGQTVVVNGTITGSVAKVTLSSACYAVPGGMRGAIRLDKNGKVMTAREGAFIVRPVIDGGQIINSGEALPSLAELMAQIHALEAANNASMLSLGINGLIVIGVEDHTLILDRVPLPDDASYETAVSLGYEGTEEEWEAFTALIDENSAAITEAMEDAAEALSLAQAAQSHGVTITILSTDWTGESAPFTATVDCSIATATNRLLVGIGGSLTTQEQAAISSASIMCTAQGAGTLTFTAYASVPTIAIPVNVMEVK